MPWELIVVLSAREVVGYSHDQKIMLYTVDMMSLSIGRGIGARPMTNTKGFVNVGKVGRPRQEMIEARGKNQRIK